MTTKPVPEPTEPTAPEPNEETATEAKVTPTPKPVRKAARKQATNKATKAALTHNQAHVAYRKQRTLLHGAGPEAYRQAAAKALGITDTEFDAAFFTAKATT